MWNIVTDSSCDDINFAHSSPDIRYDSVPFFIHTDSREFIDDGSIHTEELISVMKHSSVCKTACPSPAAWQEHFSRPGNTLAFTISGELSGSYASACTARSMVHEKQPDKKIAVINTRAAGPVSILLIREATRMIEAGLDFDAVVDNLYRMLPRVHIIYTLSSFDNLVKNGRMSRLTGFMANTLGFWGVGIATPEGKIRIKDKVRGARRVLNAILQDMKEKPRPPQEVVISHCLNPEMSAALTASIREIFGSIPVDSFPTGGLDSFYAEKNGIIVGYICKGQ